MTSAAAPTPPTPAPREVDHGPLAWLHAQDPDYLVLKRSARAAVVLSSLFAIAHFGFASSQVGLFVAFGSFALLLLVEFTGKPRTRLLSYLGLWVAGSVLIIVGTVVSTNKVAAVVTMGVVGFARAFRWDPGTPGGDGVDRGVADIRHFRGGGATGIRGRLAHDRLGDGGRVLYRVRAVGVATAVARQPSPPALHRDDHRGPFGRHAGQRAATTQPHKRP